MTFNGTSGTVIVDMILMVQNPVLKLQAQPSQKTYTNKKVIAQSDF